jgi:two-component system response regulator
MKHILLVEDNSDDEDLAVRALARSDEQYDITVARDGAAALDLLFSDRRVPLPGLILLDLSLPKVDGLEVLACIRADERTRLLPVVILTSSKQQEDILAGYNSGANAYVRKPLRFDTFSKAMDTLATFWLTVSEPPPDYVEGDAGSS